MQEIKFLYGIDPEGKGFFWPDSKQKRKEWLEVKRMRPLEAESVYQCNPGARAGAVFLEEDFAYYTAPDGLSHGISDPKVAEFCSKGAMVVQSWDTGMSAKSSADASVCVTALMMPSDKYHRGEDPLLLGDPESHYVVMILDVFRKQLDIGDLIKAGREQYLKWQPQMVIIEKKAHGSALMQALEFAGIPMEGVDPTDSKRERTVTAIGQAAGSVQGWFRLHRVRVPIGLPEETDWVPGYKREMKDFSGQKGGRDDQVDATVLVVSYGIREGGSGIVWPTGWQEIDQVDRSMTSTGNDVTENLWGHLTDESGTEDPFGNMCSRCKFYTSAMRGLQNINPRAPDEQPSFCRLWKVRKSAIDTCHNFSSPYEQSMSFSR